MEQSKDDDKCNFKNNLNQIYCNKINQCESKGKTEIFQNESDLNLHILLKSTIIKSFSENDNYFFGKTVNYSLKNNSTDAYNYFPEKNVSYYFCVMKNNNKRKKDPTYLYECVCNLKSLNVNKKRNKTCGLVYRMLCKPIGKKTDKKILQTCYLHSRNSPFNFEKDFTCLNNQSTIKRKIESLQKKHFHNNIKDKENNEIHDYKPNKIHSFLEVNLLQRPLMSTLKNVPKEILIDSLKYFLDNPEENYIIDLMIPYTDVNVFLGTPISTNRHITYKMMKMKDMVERKNSNSLFLISINKPEITLKQFVTKIQQMLQRNNHKYIFSRLYNDINIILNDLLKNDNPHSRTQANIKSIMEIDKTIISNKTYISNKISFQNYRNLLAHLKKKINDKKFLMVMDENQNNFSPLYFSGIFMHDKQIEQEFEKTEMEELTKYICYSKFYNSFLKKNKSLIDCLNNKQIQKLAFSYITNEMQRYSSLKNVLISPSTKINIQNKYNTNRDSFSLHLSKPYSKYKTKLESKSILLYKHRSNNHTKLNLKQVTLKNVLAHSNILKTVFSRNYTKSVETISPYSTYCYIPKIIVSINPNKFLKRKSGVNQRNHIKKKSIHATVNAKRKKRSHYLFRRDISQDTKNTMNPVTGNLTSSDNPLITEIGTTEIPNISLGYTPIAEYTSISNYSNSSIIPEITISYMNTTFDFTNLFLIEAAIALNCIAFVILLIFILAIFRERCKRRQQDIEEEEEENNSNRERENQTERSEQSYQEESEGMNEADEVDVSLEMKLLQSSFSKKRKKNSHTDEFYIRFDDPTTDMTTPL